MDVFEKWEARLEREREADAANQKTIFAALAALGIESVELRFDGYGDSGQIDDVIVSDAKELTGEVMVEEVVHDETKRKRACPLEDAVENLCYDILGRQMPGWMDNEGSFGVFTLNVESRAVELEFTNRFVAYETTQHCFGEA